MTDENQAPETPQTGETISVNQALETPQAASPKPNQVSEAIEPSRVPETPELTQVFKGNNPQKPKSWLVWVMIVLGIIIVAGGGYYAWAKYSDQILIKLGIKEATSVANTDDTATDTADTATTTTDPTADWKTYSNTTYGFSFKYPTDWLVKDMTSANKTLIEGMVGFYGSNPKSVGEDGFFMIQVNSQALSKLINNEKTAISNNSNEELVSESSVTKYEQSCTELKIKNKTTNIIFSKDYCTHGSSTYIVTGDSTDTDAITQTANQMNDTFQFTN